MAVRHPHVRAGTACLAGFLAAVLALAPIASWVPAASAHCPGTASHDYAYGNLSPGVSVNGIIGTIEWVEGNVCTSGVSHSINVCSTGACGHWVQVGWRFYNGYADPRMYCEYAGGQYKLVEFAVFAGSHRYKQQYDTVDKFWDCSVDGIFKFSYSLANSGMSSGTYLDAAGENHQTHVQIGKMAPSKLLFSSMQYRKVSDGSWPVMNLVLQPTVAPYGRAEPAAGQLQVWTNAH